MNCIDLRMAKALMDMRLEEVRRLTESRDLLRQAGTGSKNDYLSLEAR